MMTTDDLDPEDAKLVTLARGARARVGAAAGAALRDETGRTYSGADVRLASLRLSALQLAVAQAASSGAHGAEAAVIVAGTAASVDAAVRVDGLDALRDLAGPGIPVIVCDGSGAVVTRIST